MKVYPQKHIAELIWGRRNKLDPKVMMMDRVGGWLVGTAEQFADKMMAELDPEWEADAILALIGQPAEKSPNRWGSEGMMG